MRQQSAGNVGIVVTARVKSARLKNKVLQTINDKKTIEILLERLKMQKTYPIVLSIPNNRDNSVLQAIAEKMEVSCYRGQDDSPMHRLYDVAKEFGFDHVVRITADDILIDPLLLQMQVRFHVKGNKGNGWDYTYLKRCPEGVAGEVIKVSALERAIKNITEPIEFVSYEMKKEWSSFIEFYPPPEYQRQYRLTMDYPEDITLLRIIFNLIREPIGTLDIINLIEKNKFLLSINHLPRVTVYTVNHNYSKYIRETIRSVLSQTFSDFEYIIYDDCSTDGSMNTITEYYSTLKPEAQKKIKVLRGAENKGLPACCNRVLEIAKGRYIIRVDADDILEPQAISDMLKVSDKSDVDCVYTDYYEFDDDGNRDAVRTEERHPGCCLINKRVANELKYKEGLDFYEGREFFKRFDRSYKSFHLMSVLWGYRRHKGQKTDPVNKDKREDVRRKIDNS